MPDFHVKLCRESGEKGMQQELSTAKNNIPPYQSGTSMVLQAWIWRGYAKWLSRGLLVMALVLIIALLSGFVIFSNEISRIETASSAYEQAGPASASRRGIVVLTGDTARIGTGLKLLENRHGVRALISGVNARTSRAAVLRVSNHKSNQSSCCIDIGRVARDTRGNALETAQWVRHNGFTDLLVVTSGYHMPRSLLEMRNAIGDVRLHPVAAREKTRKTKYDENAPFFTHQQADRLRHSLKEYGKFIAAALRIWFEGGFDEKSHTVAAKSF